MGRFSPLRQAVTPVSAEEINRIQDRIKAALDETSRDITNIDNSITIIGDSIKRPEFEVIFGNGVSNPPTSNELFRVDPASNQFMWGMQTTDTLFYDVQFQGNVPAGGMSLATYNTSTTGWAAIGVSGDTAFADFFTYGSAAAGTVFSFATANLTYLDASHNLAIGPHDGYAIYFGTDDVLSGTIDAQQHVIWGRNSLATSATGGWPWLRSGAGAPSGIPTTTYNTSGHASPYWDSTNDRMYWYDGAWVSLPNTGDISRPLNEIVYGTGTGITSSSTLMFVSGQIRAPFGTAAAPTYSFGTRTNQGMYSYGASIIAIATEGADILRMTHTGFLGTTLISFTGAGANGFLSFSNIATITFDLAATNVFTNTSGNMVWQSSLASGSTSSDFSFDAVNARTAGNVVRITTDSAANTLLAVSYRGHTSLTPIASTVASSAGLTWDGLTLGASTLTLTGTTTVTALAYARIEAPTVTQTGAGAVVVTDLDGLLVTAPILGTDVTATRRNALRAVGGARFDISGSGSWTLIGPSSTLTLSQDFVQTSATSLLLYASAGLQATIGAASYDGAAASNVYTFKTTTAASALKYQGNLAAANSGADHAFDTSVTRTAGVLASFRNNTAAGLEVLATGSLSVNLQDVLGGGATRHALASMTRNGTVAGLTGTSPLYDLFISPIGAAWTDGTTIAVNYGSYFGAANYSSSSAKTISEASTVYVQGPPTGGGAGPLSITLAYALWVDDGIVRLDGATGGAGYVFQFPANAVDPTGGGGAAAGRIPCLIGGATRYLAYY